MRFKGQVGLVRERFSTPRLRVKSYEELNAWLLDRTIAFAKAHRHSYSSSSGVFDRLATAPMPPSPASCLTIREPILLDRRTLRDQSTPHPLHRVELALRGDSVGEVYAVPVFENADDWSEEVPANRSEPIAVLVVESESNLGSVVSEHFVEDRVAACAQVLGDFLMDRNTLGEEMAGAEFSEPDVTPIFHPGGARVLS